MKGKILLILFFIFSIIIGCKTLGIILIEKDMITGFKTNEIYTNKFDYIEISGLIGSSSHNYKKIDIIIEDDIMKIIMYGELSLLNKNGSGSFNINIPIDKNINRIFFGNNNEIIWERKSIKILSEREKLLEIQRFTEYDVVINKFGEPDAIVGSGFIIIQYTLSNNRKVLLNFASGRDGLLQLIELYKDNTKNIIFDFE